MIFLNAAAGEDRHAALVEAIGRALPDVPVVRPDNGMDPARITEIFTWLPMPDWQVYPNLRTVYSVSAGIDQFADLPAHVRLVRMVDPNNARRVCEFVQAACLACLRNLPKYAARQVTRDWVPATAPFMSDTTVGILGLGEIGAMTAGRLAAMGFCVEGWSRTPRQIDGVVCHSGADGLDALLAQADILVCLLPLTPSITGILDAGLFARMKQGSSLVQVGRGAHCVLPDLRAALKNGQLSQAMLDVFETEPLPAEHPGWDLPNCLVTPHIAGRIEPASAVANIVTNLCRDRAGEPLLWQVDREKGY
ncbi:2-hydroxyacid dehydrogenase [Thioclava kandeliae]|uniref:Glyoxylate/hydroxypyruvate reductase A n=1 Tax=Thioclava kandeliae TaxID=3070818 RepID=A0ABV1SM91_9RHOB